MTTKPIISSLQMKISKSEFLEMVSSKIGHDELVARYANPGLLKKN